jgi:hypothetical protein
VPPNRALVTRRRTAEAQRREAEQKEAVQREVAQRAAAQERERQQREQQNVKRKPVANKNNANRKTLKRRQGRDAQSDSKVDAPRLTKHGADDAQTRGHLRASITLKAGPETSRCCSRAAFPSLIEAVLKTSNAGATHRR